MRAVDTNLVVRVLVADDADQARRARATIEAGGVLLLPTVMLEAGWVLRKSYGIGRAEVVALLRSFLGLPGVEEAEPGGIARALDWAATGMDLADAFHLAAMPPGASFVTFDQALVRAARGLGLDAAEPPAP